MITTNEPKSKSSSALFNLDLSKTAKFVFLAIEGIIRKTGKNQFSQAKIAEVTGLARETVSRYVPELEAAGYLRVERAPKNSKICNIYHVIEDQTEFVTDSEGKEKGTVNEDKQTDSSDGQSQWHDVPSPETEPYAEVKENLVEAYGEDRVEAAIRYVKRQVNLHNPVGFLIWLLKGNSKSVDLDQLEREAFVKREPGLAYVTGKYADFIIS